MTENSMSYDDLMRFVAKIGALPLDKRGAVRLLFFNPTDAAIGVFETFGEWDGVDMLDEIIQTAKRLGIEHAGAIEDAFVEWQNAESGAHVCAHCHEPFMSVDSTAKKDDVYCSRACEMNDEAPAAPEN